MEEPKVKSEDVNKAHKLIKFLLTNPTFDLIDYYKFEERNPFEFIKAVKSSLTPEEIRTIASFAGKTKETSEWKERHYTNFYNTLLSYNGRELTLEDKKSIINRVKAMGLSVNDRTVKAMTTRYLIEVPAKEVKQPLKKSL